MSDGVDGEMGFRNPGKAQASRVDGDAAVGGDDERK